MHAYAPHPEQLRHFLDAIPGAGETPLSANQIFNRQARMRLPRREVYARLEALVYEGKVQRVVGGFMHYFRHATANKKLALFKGFAYNGAQRKELPLDANVDLLLQTLAPLTHEKIVKLWMEPPPKVAPKKSRRTSERRLIVLTPGTHLGLPRKTVMVSVIGKGSCLVRLDEAVRTADLVLAGMSARLAKELMNRIHQLFSGK